ncbi:MAG: amidohydrolase family protein [Halobacteriota archaeon]
MSGKSSLDVDGPIIDFGAHFYPEEADTSGRPGPEVEALTGYERIHDIETQVEEMHAAGVDGSVISMPYFLGHEDAEVTADANDILLDIIDPYEHLYGHASIPLVAGPQKAADEFERCLDNGYHSGGIDETDVALTDDEMKPVLEVANDTGAPIFIHVPHMPNIQYRFNAVFGRERELAQSICTVIHSGLLDEYPDLNLVYHHLGGNIASMLGRIHLHVDKGRWPLQDDMKSYPEFKQQLEERIYIDTAGFFGYHNPIRNALDELPATQVMFGTDFPWEPRDDEELSSFVEAITESATRQDAARVLGGNALDLMVNT